MRNIYYKEYGRVSLLPYDEKKDLILNSFNFNQSGMKLNKFEEILKEKYDVIFENLNKFFNYEDDKFFLYFKTIIKDSAFNELDIEIKPIVIINFNRKKFMKLKEKISYEEINIKKFENISDPKKNFIEKNIKYFDIKYVDENIRKNYPENELALNIRYFKNKIPYFVFSSKNEKELQYICNYLNQNINFFEEIRIIKKEKIDKKFEYTRLVNMYVDNEKKKLKCKLDKENRYEEKLNDLFVQAKEKSKYTKLMNEIVEQFRFNFDISIDLPSFVSDLEAQKYTFRQINREVDLIVINEDKSNYEVDEAVKKIIFDKYLDIERNINEAAELLSEYIEDHYQLFYDILIGYFSESGKSEKYYQQIKYEIIEEDYMKLNKLLEYIDVSKKEITIENEKYSVIIKKNYV